MAKAIKTIKVKIHNPNKGLPSSEAKGKEEALNHTVDILNKVLATYIDLILANNHLLSKKKECKSLKTGKVYTRKLTNQELLGEIEKISFETSAHPNPQIDRKPNVASPLCSLRSVSNCSLRSASDWRVRWFSVGDRRGDSGFARLLREPLREVNIHALYPSLPAYFRRSGFAPVTGSEGNAGVASPTLSVWETETLAKRKLTPARLKFCCKSRKRSRFIGRAVGTNLIARGGVAYGVWAIVDTTFR